jgi:hypothetical protein
MAINAMRTMSSQRVRAESPPIFLLFFFFSVASAETFSSSRPGFGSYSAIGAHGALLAELHV